MASRPIHPSTRELIMTNTTPTTRSADDGGPGVRPSRKARAFTLVEMLLALAICSLVGLTVALLLGGIGAATRESQDTRRTVVQRQVAVARLGALTRGTAMVLSKGSNHVVLWKGDMTGNGKPNLSELRRIEWDANTNEVWTYEAPSSLSAAADTAYDLTADFSAATASLAGTASFPGQTTLQEVAAWNTTLDNASTQSAKLLRVTVTLTQDTGSDNATIIAYLRATTN